MGRGEQGEMGCQGDLLASMAPGFLSQPNQGRSAFICFISMIWDLVWKNATLLKNDGIKVKKKKTLELCPPTSNHRFLWGLMNAFVHIPWASLEIVAESTPTRMLMNSRVILACFHTLLTLISIREDQVQHRL